MLQTGERRLVDGELTEGPLEFVQVLVEPVPRWFWLEIGILAGVLAWMDRWADGYKDLGVDIWIDLYRVE
jgi:hypothetical protein